VSNVLLGLGPFRFAVNSLNHQQLARRFEYRWEAQCSIGRWPVGRYKSRLRQPLSHGPP
jgi:phage protein U